jgi:hypothetical protein
MSLEQVALLSAVIPIPLARFTLFWRDSVIKVNRRTSFRNPKESTSCCVVRIDCWSVLIQWADSTPCFVSVQNACEQGANLSSEC